MEVRDKDVTVVGLGNSGFSAAALLKDLGARVRVTDSNDSAAVRKNAELLARKDIAVETGRHTADFVKGSSLVVVSPGVETSSPVIKWASEFKIPIISELELGYSFCAGSIVAITGTNGKSTVTTLVGEMLKASGADTVVCGNIGNALSGEIKRMTRDTRVVLEVSSFQLERIRDFRPRIAVILNITDDHLDRYRTFREYYNEKMKIFLNQRGAESLVLNYDAKNLRPIKDKARSRIFFYSRQKKVNGAYLDGDRFIVSLDGRETEICRTGDIKLKGLHNFENVLASSLAACLAGAEPKSMRDAIRDFKGLSHRFETVEIINGVEYIDDSKGTTVDSTRRALESCGKKVILIAGGKDKNSDYGAVSGIVREKVLELILIGEAADKIGRALAGVVKTRKAATLEEAVEAAYGIAGPDTIVLLSPMCSSFDMFKDYKERGEIFKAAVKELKKSVQGVRA